MMFANTDQISHQLHKKRKAKEDSWSQCVRVWDWPEAYKRCHIIPRVCRNPVKSKAETFKGWFNKTDQTWITVVSLPVVCQLTVDSPNWSHRWTSHVIRSQERMQRTAFKKLLYLIRPCPIFHNNSNCPQAPVKWQLLVTLANLGLSGNGGGSPIKAKLFSLAGELV